MKKIPVIIECDPGHDDAIALLLAFASERLHVLGVTVVAGNHVLSKTTRNALTVLNYAGIDSPVFAGYEKPLMRELIIAPEVHGESGIDGPQLPAPKTRVQKEHAVTYLINTLRRSQEKVTLISTGPLTNIAAALLGAPDIKKKIQDCFYGWCCLWRELESCGRV